MAKPENKQTNTLTDIMGGVDNSTTSTGAYTETLPDGTTISGPIGPCGPTGPIGPTGIQAPKGPETPHTIEQPQVNMYDLINALKDLKGQPTTASKDESIAERMSRERADNEAVKRSQYEFLERCQNAPKKGVTVPSMLAEYIGKVYTYTLNGTSVTLFCDDKVHYYSDFIADHIVHKLSRMMKGNTAKIVVTEFGSEE